MDVGSILLYNTHGWHAQTQCARVSGAGSRTLSHLGRFSITLLAETGVAASESSLKIRDGIQISPNRTGRSSCWRKHDQIPQWTAVGNNNHPLTAGRVPTVWLDRLPG